MLYTFCFEWVDKSGVVAWLGAEVVTAARVLESAHVWTAHVWFHPGPGPECFA